MGLITRETEHARSGEPAHIIGKMNSLVDEDVITALYGASQAGVRIDLLIRGICCLRPGVPGVSETIRVHALIDRFLEHARIFYFENGGDQEVFCSSADWMPRNFRRRVEVMFPVLDTGHKKRLVEEILELMRTDNVKGWLLGADGAYSRVKRGQSPLRSQTRFMELARERAREAEPLKLSNRQFTAVSDARTALDKLRSIRSKRRRKRRG